MHRVQSLLLVVAVTAVVVSQAAQETADRGRVTAEIARELVTRSASNSQVLSLNLSNLLILVVLKALLFGAGAFSFGLTKGRLEPTTLQPTLTEPELLLALSFLMGEADGGFSCLHRVACAEPGKAREYAAGADMLVKGAKVFNSLLPYNPRYEAIVTDLRKAVEFGASGGKCETRYSCSKPH